MEEGLLVKGGGHDGTKEGEDAKETEKETKKETEKVTRTDRADRNRLKCMRSKAVDEVMLPYIRWFNPNWPNVSSSVSATSNGSNIHGSNSNGSGGNNGGNDGGNDGVGEFIFDTGNGAPERSWAAEWADHMMTKKGGRDMLGLRSWPRPIPPLAPFIAWCAVVDGSKKECGVCVCVCVCVL